MASGDLVFVNGLVRTLDPANPTAGAVLVRDGRVVLAGELDDVRGQASGAREIDLGGGTLLPGFIESHNHFMDAGQAFAQVDCRGDRVSSIADLQRVIRERAEQTPAGGWVLGRGYDQTLLAEDRHPTRADLDEAAPDHPVIIWHISYHGLVANSAALQRAGIDRNTDDVPGGVQVKIRITVECEDGDKPACVADTLSRWYF